MGNSARKGEGGRGLGLLKAALFPLAAILLIFPLLAPSELCGQSPTSALVTGVVKDPSGAVVPGATVRLLNKTTNVAQTTKTDTAGEYVFAAVTPGDYRLETSAAGFQISAVAQVHVEVLKAYTVNVALQVGQMTQTVQVSVNPGAELQTMNATVGQTLETSALENLPAYTRSATSLMFLQPGVNPPSPVANGSDPEHGGQVSGARSDETTFNLDGGDVTSDLEGSNSFVAPPREPEPAPVVPIPIESTQEFRVATANPNSVFSRSSGGDVAIITKSGTNNFHGSVYEYHDDDALDANSWTNNRSKLHKPHSVDNRFGYTFGGPVWRNRVWFFSSYEGHRFYDNATLTRLVPTSTFKSGIIEFPDASGNVNAYSLQPGNISTACNGGLCDPRNIGLSPAVQKQLALYPNGNNRSFGDGFNTIGYTFNVATPVTADVGVLRLDGKINDRWNAFATYHVAKETVAANNQINVISNPPQSVSSNPFYPSYFTLQLTGQVTSHLTAVTHGSFLRHWWGWSRVPPTPFVSGVGQALELAGEGIGNNNGTGKLFADPVNIDTQNARARIWDGHDWYFAQDWSWINGHHLYQFGAAGYIWHDFHSRTDDVFGGLTTGPIDYLEATGNGSGEFAHVGSAFEPPLCSGSVKTSCIPSTDELRWDELYAASLGLVDRSAQIETRNGLFQPNPLGSNLFDNVTIPSYYLYFQDVLQLRPSLTFTYGVDWGVQLPPSEAQGKEEVLTYAGSNTPVNFYGYIQNRAASLNSGVQAGQAYNPLFGMTPVDFLPAPLNRASRFAAWHDFGPRVSLAWNVPYHNRLFGDHQTVIRVGYGVLFDRTIAGWEALANLLTGGLADVDACAGPTFSGGGPVCTGQATSPSTAFRIGVDGNNVPIPAPHSLAIPYVPSGSQAAPFGLFFSNELDP